MPWRETTPMHQRTLFIADHLRGTRSVTELCAEYGISRKTAYKWIDRYIRRGPSGLEDRSRCPRDTPTATPAPIVDTLIALRHRHPTWGPKKLLAYLRRGHPTWRLPGRSVTAALLKRRGLIRRRTPRRVIGHPGKPTALIVAPNQVWCADFKGQFRMGNGRYCYPLTVTDGFSRYLLGCHGLPSTAVQGTKPVFTRLFQEYGLPQYIRSDNGVPFATNTLARLSRLSAWWVRLGILPQLIEPGRPQQNGRHERMHRTLKQEATRPPGHPRARCARSSGGSIASAASSTRSGRTKHSTSGHPRRCISHRHARCRASCPHSSIPIASRCGTSAPMAGFAGTKPGSTCPPPASASTSASRNSTTGSGTCTSAPSDSVASWNDR